MVAELVAAPPDPDVECPPGVAAAAWALPRCVSAASAVAAGETSPLAGGAGGVALEAPVGATVVLPAAGEPAAEPVRWEPAAFARPGAGDELWLSAADASSASLWPSRVLASPLSACASAARRVLGADFELATLAAGVELAVLGAVAFVVGSSVLEAFCGAGSCAPSRVARPAFRAPVEELACVAASVAPADSAVVSVLAEVVSVEGAAVLVASARPATVAAVELAVAVAPLVVAFVVVAAPAGVAALAVDAASAGWP